MSLWPFFSLLHGRKISVSSSLRLICGDTPILIHLTIGNVKIQALGSLSSTNPRSHWEGISSHLLSTQHTCYKSWHLACTLWKFASQHLGNSAMYFYDYFIPSLSWPEFSLFTRNGLEGLSQKGFRCVHWRSPMNQGFHASWLCRPSKPKLSDREE